MVDAIDVLLGEGLDPKADMGALAKQLRGERDLGRFMSLSTIPQVSKLGTSQIGSAESAAQRGGVLRGARRREAENKRRYEAGVTTAAEALQYGRGRDTAKDTREAAALQRKLGKLGKAEPFSVVGSDDIEYLQQKADGSYVNEAGKPADMSRFEPYVKPSTRGMAGFVVREYKDANGIPTVRRTDRATGNSTREFMDGTPYTKEESDRRVAEVGTLAAEQAGKKKFSELTSKEKVERHAEAVQVAQGYRSTERELNNALNAVEEGARTGAIISELPTFTQATARLEEAMDTLALTQIGEHTFGSLSQAEGDWLRMTSINLRQPPERLKAELKHRIEGVKYLKAANRYVRKQLAAGKDVDEDEVERLMYNDGKYAYDTPTESEAEAINRATGIPAAIRAHPALKNRWLTLDAEEQKRIMDQLGQ